MTERPGRIELLCDLSAGGMGVVSVARLHGERGFSRLVAVKRIHPRFAEDPSFAALLAREARLSAAISHPNVVRIHELTAVDDQLLLVMELVEGTTLRQLVGGLAGNDVELPLPVIARVLVECARGLHAAHEARDEEDRPLGLVHRDVSPQNVLLSFEGDVKVSDFGVAKALEHEAASSSSVVRGKPAYLSPEQARGEDLDRTTDIWSFGVVAWELIAGRRLFKSGNDYETLRRLLEEPIARLDAVRPMPSLVADVVDRCLQRDRAARFQSADAVAEALETAVPELLTVSRGTIAEWVARAMPEERERVAAMIRRARSSGVPVVEPPPPRRKPSRVRRPLFAVAGFCAVVAGHALWAGPPARSEDTSPAIVDPLPEGAEAPVPTPAAAAEASTAQERAPSAPGEATAVDDDPGTAEAPREEPPRRSDPVAAPERGRERTRPSAAPPAAGPRSRLESVVEAAAAQERRAAPPGPAPTRPPSEPPAARSTDPRPATSPDPTTPTKAPPPRREFIEEFPL